MERNQQHECAKRQFAEMTDQSRNLNSTNFFVNSVILLRYKMVIRVEISNWPNLVFIIKSYLKKTARIFQNSCKCHFLMSHLQKFWHVILWNNPLAENFASNFKDFYTFVFLVSWFWKNITNLPIHRLQLDLVLTHEITLRLPKIHLYFYFLSIFHHADLSKKVWFWSVHHLELHLNTTSQSFINHPISSIKRDCCQILLLMLRKFM